MKHEIFPLCMETTLSASDTDGFMTGLNTVSSAEEDYLDAYMTQLLTDFVAFTLG